MYTICKTIHFCYGHRLMDYEGRCGHLHGHSAKVDLVLAGNVLDKRDLLFDFGDVETMVKGWIDREFDHRLLLKRGDPLIGPLKELGEPVVVLDMNPSAEGIARTIFQYLVEKGMPVKEVKVWETGSAWASYCRTDSE